MRDLDELLGDDLSGAAAEAARTPDFDTLTARGRRRATLRRTTLAGAAALAVVTVIGATQWLGGSGPSSDPAPVAPVPSGSEVTDDIDWELPDAATSKEAESVIDDPDAVALAAAVDPAARDARVVMWATCADPCDSTRRAIAVTGDDFATRVGLPDGEYGRIVPAGDGVFVAETYEPGEPPVLLSARGSSEVRLEKAESPLRDGEVLVALHGSGLPVLGLVAVDPRTGVGHPIPLPGRGIRGWSGAGRTLMVLVGQQVRRSDDGGATWTSTPVPDQAGALTWLAESADPGTGAVLAGGDGSPYPYPSLKATVRFRGGEDPETFAHDTPPRAHFAGAFVLPDGRLLVAVNEWSDETEHALGEQGEEVTSSGVYVSTDDWGSLEQVPGVLEGRAPLGSFVVAADGTPSLVVTPQGGDELMFSTDGDSWETLSAR